MIALPLSAEESTPAGRVALLRALLELRTPPRHALALLAHRGDPDALALLGEPAELTVYPDPPPPGAQGPRGPLDPPLELVRFEAAENAPSSKLNDANQTAARREMENPDAQYHTPRRHRKRIRRTYTGQNVPTGRPAVKRRRSRSRSTSL